MNTVRRNAPFLILFVLAGVFAGIVWFVMPHDREVKSLGILLFKLVPFVLATEAVAQLDPAWARRIHLHLAIPLCFLVYFIYFVPKIFFVAEDHPELYYYILTLTPFVVLSLVFSFRVGGGASHLVRRLSYAMILLMLSGVEDYAYLTVNEHTDPQWQTIPEVWTWASHMTVFLGHAASKYEAYAFIITHLVLVVFVLFAPTRWFTPVARLLRRSGRPGSEVRGSGAGEATTRDAADRDARTTDAGARAAG